ncbi:MAG: hypothetical protein GY929_27680, partial [Actinomycetia bacterium]|nr:hypothetical protein [Actinomycetes bacterium]
DRPVKALPVPFDTLAPDIESISVAADSPMGNLGLDVAPNVGSLRQMLNGSMSPETTMVPGEDPGEPTTWLVRNVRITAVTLSIAAFDATPSAHEILVMYGPDRIEFVMRGSPIMTLAEALTGVANQSPASSDADPAIGQTGSPRSA